MIRKKPASERISFYFDNFNSNCSKFLISLFFLPFSSFSSLLSHSFYRVLSATALNSLYLQITYQQLDLVSIRRFNTPSDPVGETLFFFFFSFGRATNNNARTTPHQKTSRQSTTTTKPDTHIASNRPNSPAAYKLHLQEQAR